MKKALVTGINGMDGSHLADLLLEKGYEVFGMERRVSTPNRTNSKHLEKLKNENLIAFKYCDHKGSVSEKSNPNGALENIAGIFNSKKNILGMMPHPERMIDKMVSNTDGINLFSSLIN